MYRYIGGTAQDVVDIPSKCEKHITIKKQTGK